MNRKIQLSLLVITSLLLSACATKEGPIVEEPAPAPVVDNNAWGTGMSESDLAGYGIYGDPANEMTMYFEYNSSAISKRSMIIAEAHARKLARSGGKQVTLEGHADERGTRDYNLALGERRSQAIAGHMSAYGAGGSSFNNISLGEERPIDPSHTEEAWKKNRRVEISY